MFLGWLNKKYQFLKVYVLNNVSKKPKNRIFEFENCNMKVGIKIDQLEIYFACEIVLIFLWFSLNCSIMFFNIAIFFEILFFLAYSFIRLHVKIIWSLFNKDSWLVTTDNVVYVIINLLYMQKIVLWKKIDFKYFFHNNNKLNEFRSESVSFYLVSSLKIDLDCLHILVACVFYV